MEMMKKLLTASFTCLFCLLLQAQESTYSLPATTFKIEVDAVQEYFFAGPYAAYAPKLLGISAPEKDAVTSHVTRVSLQPCVEADPDARYPVEPGTEYLMNLSVQGLVCFRDTLEAGSLTWRFSPIPPRDYSDKGLTASTIMRTETTVEIVQVDTGFVRRPVSRKVPDTKSLEEKAAEAAEIILSARTERMNIAMGNTDATFSGEALGAALDELKRIEEEYLALFRGYTVERPLHGVFDVRPSADERVQRYVAFLLSDADGLKAEGRGTPFYLELEAESVPEPTEPADRRRRVLHYREPAICTVRLTQDGRTLLVSRAPVYQLGPECTYPVK
jgi:hypothetical protein